MSPSQRRFGVSDLVQLCEQVPAVVDLEGEQPEETSEDCESRAETFLELLRSVWVDNEEEAETLLKPELWTAGGHLASPSGPGRGWHSPTTPYPCFPPQGS